MSTYLKEPNLKTDLKPDVSVVPNPIKKNTNRFASKLKQKKDKYKALSRKKAKLPSCNFFLPKLPKIDMVTFGLGSGFITILLVWYSIQYYELFVPFISGGIRLFKYFLICTAIIYFMLTFVQTSYSFYWWYESTLYYFRRGVDPLLNQKVKYYYYYFTDYINWAIFYPARSYYFFRFAVNVMFFLLIILPIMAFIAFFIGLLFSWLGEAKDETSVMDPIVEEVKNMANSAKTQAANLVGNVSSQTSQMASSLGLGKVSDSKGNLSNESSKLGNVAKGMDLSKLGNMAKGMDLSKLGNMAKGMDLSKLGNMAKGMDLSKLGNVAKGMDLSKLGNVAKGMDLSKLGNVAKGMDLSKLGNMAKGMDLSKLGDVAKGDPSKLADMIPGAGGKVAGMVAQHPGLMDKVKKLAGAAPKLMSLAQNPMKLAGKMASFAFNPKLAKMAPILMAEAPKMMGKSPEQMLESISQKPELVKSVMEATDALVDLVVK